MALYIPHSIFHLARLMYVSPETFGPYYVHFFTWLRLLLFGVFLPRTPEFCLGPVLLGIVRKKWQNGTDFPMNLAVFPVSIFPRIFHSHSLYLYFFNCDVPS
jgi:hypothetical protein